MRRSNTTAVVSPSQAARRCGAIALAATVLALAGCATSEKFSYLDGRRYHLTELNTYNASVVSVDGEYYLWNPARVDPGLRKIVVQAPPVAGFHEGTQRTFELDVQPCTRYWLAAVRKSPLRQDFEPRVDYSEPIAGCGVAKP